MKIGPHSPRPKAWFCCASVALVVAAAGAVRAADVDIYRNQSFGVKPNVMFSIDTSGSMGGRMMVWPDYDPSERYDGPFDRTQYYLSTSGRIPKSPGGVSNAPMSTLPGCQFAEQAVAEDGFSGVRTAFAFSRNSAVAVSKQRWIPGNKVEFSVSDSGEVQLECSDDAGTHGVTGGGVYAAADGALYTNDPNKELDWRKFPFVTVFAGNYLNYKANPPPNERQSREHVQKRVIRDAVKRMPDIFAGLAEIHRRGGRILHALKDNTVRANQQQFIDRLESTASDWGSPLAGSMMEVMHYYLGKPVFLNEPVDTDAMDGGNYQSPIISACQKSFAVMVTDGVPWNDNHASSAFTSSNPLFPDYQTLIGQDRCKGSCLNEIARYLSRGDASASLPNDYDMDNDGAPDPQTVQVYPIGMETRQRVLDNMARAAGTRTYYADSAAEFEDSVSEILAEIKESVGRSMVTAASGNDRFSKTSNRNFLYYGQFVPSNKAQWRGNLKKYRYVYDKQGVAYITDSRPAKREITNPDGSIIARARSFWSTTNDGNNTLKGGVAERLKAQTPGGRQIYGIHNWNDTRQPIMQAGQRISGLGNAFMDAEMNLLGRSQEEQEAVVRYAIGQDAKDENLNGDFTEQRGTLGAIVRSSPVPVQYGGTATDPEVVVFATTTDGMLHAFDDKTGDELWAVVLPEAYSKFGRQYDNYDSASPWWGIDGSMTARVVDQNRNGIIESGDKVLLYISGGLSLRRWFIIDVSNARSASNQATLVRRGKYDPGSADWDELGLATATMVPLSYRLQGDMGGVVRRGMIYANGWDPDAEFSYGPSSMGRGISLYDADDGSPLWQMKHSGVNSQMRYAFATEPTVVDLDGDGFSDLIYAIDVNANIWRFNVNNGAPDVSTLISGGKLAQLGSNSAGQRLRSYKRIDAALTQNANGLKVLLTVGTGDRMNPLSDSDQDRLYMVADNTAGSRRPPTKVLMHNTDFFDATDNVLGEGSGSGKAAAITQIQSKSGWYINLPKGQKSISAPLISGGVANFPVYEVGNDSHDPCVNANIGSGLLYRVNVLDATPVSDYNGSGSSDLSAEDRYTLLSGGGIPGDVRFHTSSEGVKTIVVNMETFVNRPDPSDPSKSAGIDIELRSDSAGYWFDNNMKAPQ